MRPRFTFATAVTTLRIIMTPFAALAIIQRSWEHALALSICAVATDLIDGPCARWWNQVTAFGAALDGLADKLFMISMFSALLITTPAAPAWVIIPVICKEIVLVIGGCFLHFGLHSAAPKPTLLGKIALAGQFLFLAVTLSAHTNQYVFSSFAQFALNSALLCTISIVLADYAIISARMLLSPLKK